MPTFYFLHKYAYVGNIIKLIAFYEFQIMNIFENKLFPPLNEKLTNYSTAVTIVTGQLTPN